MTFFGCSESEKDINRSQSESVTAIQLGNSEFTCKKEGLELSIIEDDESHQHISCRYDKENVLIDGEYTTHEKDTLKKYIENKLQMYDFEASSTKSMSGDDFIITKYQNENSESVTGLWYQDKEGFYCISIINDENESFLKSILSSINGDGIISIKNNLFESEDEDEYKDYMELVDDSKLQNAVESIK